MMFFVWMFIFGLLEVTILNSLDLLLILVVFAGLRKGTAFAFLTGATAGTYAGIFSASTFALNIVLYSIIGLLCGLVKQRFCYYKENLWMQAGFCFCGVSLFYLLYFLMTKRTDPYIIFSTIIFSSAISPLVFRMVGNAAQDA